MSHMDGEGRLPGGGAIQTELSTEKGSLGTTNMEIMQETSSSWSDWSGGVVSRGHNVMDI